MCQNKRELSILQYFKDKIENPPELNIDDNNLSLYQKTSQLINYEICYGNIPEKYKTDEQLFELFKEKCVAFAPYDTIKKYLYELTFSNENVISLIYNNNLSRHQKIDLICILTLINYPHTSFVQLKNILNRIPQLNYEQKIKRGVFNNLNNHFTIIANMQHRTSGAIKTSDFAR